MGGLTDDVLLARALLSRIAEPATIPLWAFVRKEGPVAAVAAIRSGTADADVLAATARIDGADPAADLAAAERHGLRLIAPESPEWPHFGLAALEAAGLRRLERYRAGDRAHSASGELIPPLALWVRGPLDPTSLGANSVGIVGARAATPYGERVAAEFAFGLAGRGHEIVSGGAYGIDAAAHRAALAGEGVTTLVSAGGLDAAYPPAHRTLFDKVAEHGLLICESPPGSAPRRRRFLTRNRLIASLSAATVVIEASRRSGALNTASHALALGRHVLAVPGPITSAASAGCHQLIGDNPDRVTLAASIDVVAASLGTTAGPAGPGAVGAAATGASGGTDSARDPATDPLGRRGASGRGLGHGLGGASGSATGERRRVRQALDGLDDLPRRVYDGLPARGGLQPEDLARACGLPVLDIIRAVPHLEVAGLVERRGAAIAIRRATPGGAGVGRVPN